MQAERGLEREYGRETCVDEEAARGGLGRQRSQGELEEEGGI